MILASQNVQIAEEKDFVREKISVIFFVNTSQTKEHCESSALLFGNEAHLRCMKNEAELRSVKRAFGSRRD